MIIWTIVSAVIVFSVLIFVHELGHFCTAKWAGVKVNEFALGMGPAIFKFTRGETIYALRAFPIGGFCAMEGENEDSHDNRAFCNASVPRRLMITIAGSVMNLLLGLVLLGILSSQQPLMGTTVVAAFNEEAVSNAQLQVGDKITRINNHKVNTDNDMKYEFMRDRDGIMDIQVVRDSQTITLKSVAFTMRTQEDGTQLMYLDFKVLGVPPTTMGVVKNAFNWTGSIVKQVWGALVDLATGRYGLNQLSGPVGVTTAIGQASSMGWEPLLMLISFITVNLGVFNLLPIPALDGGRLLFLLLEAIRRKPINPRYEGYVHGVGFLLLIGLMIFVTFNDVIKLF